MVELDRNDEANRIFRARLAVWMEYLGLTNASLAKAIGVDSSLISRWRTGKRSIAGNPEYAVLIARYLVPRIASRADRDWLKRQLAEDLGIEEAELEAELVSNAARWLFPGHARLLDNPSQEERTAVFLVSSFAEAVTAEDGLQRQTAIERLQPASGDVIAAIGEQQVEELLRQCLSKAEPASEVLVYLSSESIRSIRRAGVASALKSACAKKDLRVCMLVQSANNTAASSELLATYMPMLVIGQLLLLVTQGVPQSMFGTWGVLAPDRAALTVNETLSGDSRPIATLVTDERHLTDIRQSFERSKRFAHPLMTMMDDQSSRTVVEIFFQEYGVPGNLDVIKNGLNPLFFAPEDYDDVLRGYGLPKEEFDWRQREFLRFKQAMAEVMRESVFREVLSLPRLREIARTGTCRMPGIYFFNTGIHEIGPKDCAALLEGYIRALETEPNFSVIVLDDEQLFLPNSCWHIKLNKHVMIHTWNSDHPTLIYSDQLILIDEFQKHFVALWDRLTQIGSENRKAIEKLRALAAQFRKRAEGPAARETSSGVGAD